MFFRNVCKLRHGVISHKISTIQNHSCEGLEINKLECRLVNSSIHIYTCWELESWRLTEPEIRGADKSLIP
jgi:hypothetical protein